MGTKEKAEYYLESFELLRTSIEHLPEEEQRVIADNTDDITATVETVKRHRHILTTIHIWMI